VPGGKRLLVIEDEFVIALDLQNLLEAAGHEVVALAASVAEALALLAAEGTAPDDHHRPALDGAVLDVNLRGEPATPVADALAARGVPFVFVSGYGAAGRPPGHEAAPVLAKPYSEGDLLELVGRF
jgi:CheY-like chemotaxis protein